MGWQGSAPDTFGDGALAVIRPFFETAGVEIETV
jgi:hypothetical protein